MVNKLPTPNDRNLRDRASFNFGVSRVYSGNANSNVERTPAFMEGVLFDGKVEKNTTYGQVFMFTGSYITFTANEKCNIWAIGGSYSNASGSTGQKVNLEKLVNGTYTPFLTNVQTYDDSKWYLMFENLEVGTYRMSNVNNHTSFEEWYVEGEKYDSMIFKDTSSNKFYSIVNDAVFVLPNSSAKNIGLYGIDVSGRTKLNTIFKKIKTVVDNGDDTQTITEEDVDSFTIYDMFSAEVELLYYTEKSSVTNPSVTLESNWSPIDELLGDFEVVTWSEEENLNMQLDIRAIPSPKLVYSLNIEDVFGIIDSIITTDLSVYYNKSNVRYLLSPDNVDWYTFREGKFEKLINISNDTINTKGLNYTEVSSLSNVEFDEWSFDELNIGVYLSDDIRNNVISKVSDIGFIESIPTGTSSVSDASFYILNTTATINVDFNGLTLTGQVSDEDSTRVQYKVLLNGVAYYPSDGNFTTLSNSPNSIDITLSSDDIDIDKWNTIEVVFKDYFGTEDSWSEQFIGKYASLMFSDENGEYYSTDMGVVLKYLDFGEVLIGRTTPVYKVNLKNQYGYNVTDVALTADTNAFPDGLEIQFSTNDDFSDVRNTIQFGNLAIDEVKPFYVRMNSPLNTEPNGSNTFDIYVSAKREV